MKTIKATAIVAILAASLVFATVSPAEARKTTNDDKLSPKSYGIKTFQKTTMEKSYPDNSEQKKSFSKSEQIKTKLKQIEAKKALEFVKKTYKT